MSEDKHRIKDEDTMMMDEELSQLKKILEKLMESGNMLVYGDEDSTEEIVPSHCCRKKKICKSICCSFIFALTKEEVERGLIKWNQKRPYFIDREKDGFCPHLDRKRLRCCIYNDRPKRCRKYHCNNDSNVWRDWDKGILNSTVFDHLPKKT